MDIEFTRTGPEDLERLNDLVNEEDIVRYLDLIPPVALKQTKDFFEFMKIRNGLWWCIRAGEEIIGSIGIIPGAQGTKMGHSGEMFIYITGDFWGRHIGTKAISYAVSEAKKTGLERIEVLVAEGNLRAVRLYETNGFLLEGRKRNAFKIGDNYQDIMVFGLPIR